MINNAIAKLGEERVMIAPSCSLLHVPCDLDLETNEKVLSPEIKQWFAFAKQKIEEVVVLKQLSGSKGNESTELLYKNNQKAIKSRETSTLIHIDAVRDRLNLMEHYEEMKRKPFPSRKKKQQKYIDLPLFPTTTIGSFPQTSEVRSWRAKLKKKELTLNEYNRLIQQEIEKVIRWLENVGLDVLVHGEFERNDMVEYFGEMLDGFTFTRNGWVQSYGSRYVKPPIIFGDVLRPIPMTVDWIKYAQSLTSKPVKGMLTGPVTNSPRVPTRNEMVDLLKKAAVVIPKENIWVNPDCGLKTRGWEETNKAIIEMVNAARLVREKI